MRSSPGTDISGAPVFPSPQNPTFDLSQSSFDLQSPQLVEHLCSYFMNLTPCFQNSFVSFKCSLLFVSMFDDTGKLTLEAFRKINIKKVLWYMDFLKEKSPRHRPRYSQQAWLRQDKNADPILRRLLER